MALKALFMPSYKMLNNTANHKNLKSLQNKLTTNGRELLANLKSIFKPFGPWLMQQNKTIEKIPARKEIKIKPPIK